MEYGCVLGIAIPKFTNSDILIYSEPRCNSLSAQWLYAEQYPETFITVCQQVRDMVSVILGSCNLCPDDIVNKGKILRLVEENPGRRSHDIA